MANHLLFTNYTEEEGGNYSLQSTSRNSGDLNITHLSFQAEMMRWRLWFTRSYMYTSCGSQERLCLFRLKVGSKCHKCLLSQTVMRNKYTNNGNLIGWHIWVYRRTCSHVRTVIWMELELILNRFNGQKLGFNYIKYGFNNNVLNGQAIASSCDGYMFKFNWLIS